MAGSLKQDFSCWEGKGIVAANGAFPPEFWEEVWAYRLKSRKLPQPGLGREAKALASRLSGRTTHPCLTNPTTS